MATTMKFVSFAMLLALIFSDLLLRKVIRCAAILIQNSENAIQLKMKSDATIGVLKVVIMAKVVSASIFIMEDNAIVSVN
ncbi:unnamed protein product, partial [Thlaspi arvense]